MHLLFIKEFFFKKKHEQETVMNVLSPKNILSILFK